MPTLLIQTGPRSGTRLHILGERFAIGRDPECDAIIGDMLPCATRKEINRFSRRHALLTFTGRRCRHHAAGCAQNDDITIVCFTRAAG